MEYEVIWRIELYAENPRQAAELALAIHRDQTSLATVFEVIDEHGEQTNIDLLTEFDCQRTRNEP